MQRLVAGLSFFVFLAACSDSPTTSPGRLHPSAAAFNAGEPPPPPLSGSGFGSLDPFGGEAGINTASVISTSAQSSCPFDPAAIFSLTYQYKYLLTNTLNNEMAHLDVSGATTGQITIHDLGNGKSDAHGRLQNANFIFDITDGTGEISIDLVFNYTVSGTLTNLLTGAKCQVSFGFLHGNLFTSTG